MPDFYFACRRSGLLRPFAATACLLGAAGPAWAQSPRYAEVRLGSALLMGWSPATPDYTFVESGLPAVELRREWPATESLSYTAHLRTGAWGSRYRTDNVAAGSADVDGVLGQVGGGLRYADFMNLGRFLEPFVGVQLSAAFATYLPGNYYAPPPGLRRLTGLVSAEAGLQCWASSTGGPKLTLSAHQLLRPMHAAYRLLDPGYGPAPQPFEVRIQALSRYAGLMLGWRWQLAARPPRPRWNTPRYSFPTGPVTEE